MCEDALKTYVSGEGRLGGKKQRLVGGSLKRIVQAGRGGNSDSARGRLTERTLPLPPRDAPYPREPNPSGGKPFPIRPSTRKGPTQAHLRSCATRGGATPTPPSQGSQRGQGCAAHRYLEPMRLGFRDAGRGARRADLDSALASAGLSWAFSSPGEKTSGQARTSFVWTVRVCYARLSGLPVGYAVFPRA